LGWGQGGGEKDRREKSWWDSGWAKIKLLAAGQGGPERAICKRGYKILGDAGLGGGRSRGGVWKKYLSGGG